MILSLKRVSDGQTKKISPTPEFKNGVVLKTLSGQKPKGVSLGEQLCGKEPIRTLKTEEVHLRHKNAANLIPKILLLATYVKIKI